MLTFLGDGALGEGAVYESLNIASKFNLPILFVVENNKYAQSTPIEANLAGSIKKRFESFDIGSLEVSTNDVEILLKKLTQLIKCSNYEEKF